MKYELSLKYLNRAYLCNQLGIISYSLPWTDNDTGQMNDLGTDLQQCQGIRERGKTSVNATHGSSVSYLWLDLSLMKLLHLQQ